MLLSAALVALSVRPPWTPQGDTLASLWQVQGAVVGFAVAVAVFGYEALARWGPVSAGLARSAFFPVAIHFGLAGLILTGIAQASTESRASWVTAFPMLARWTDWAALFAVTFALVWSVLLLRAFQEAVRAAHPEYRYDIQRRLLVEGAKATARRDLVLAIANDRLRELVHEAGGALEPWLSLPAATAESNLVRAASTGDLVDVHTGRVLEAVRRSAAGRNALTLALSVGGPMRRQTAYAYGPGPVDYLTRLLLTRSVVLGSTQRGDAVGELLDELTSQTRESVGNAGLVKRYLDALDETLDAYVAATVVAVASSRPRLLSGFRDSPVEAARRAIFDLMRSALARESHDAALELAYYPAHLLSRGIATGTDAYFPLLSLMPNFYSLAIRNPQPKSTADVVRDRSWFHLVEALRLVIPALARPEMPPINRDLLLRARIAVRRQLADITRIATHVGDFNTFAELLRQWRLAERDEL